MLDGGVTLVLSADEFFDSTPRHGIGCGADMSVSSIKASAVEALEVPDSANQRRRCPHLHLSMFLGLTIAQAMLLAGTMLA